MSGKIKIALVVLVGAVISGVAYYLNRNSNKNEDSEKPQSNKRGLFPDLSDIPTKINFVFSFEPLSVVFMSVGIMAAGIIIAVVAKKA